MPLKSKVSPENESINTPILIKAYGEFWNPDAVNWENKRENKWRLMGRRQAKGPSSNVYEERGVYVLYQDFVPVYVGRADRQSIGYRLKLHRESRRKGPRWDRFSWFGFRGIKPNGQLKGRNKAAHPSTTELIATLEALLIIVIDPRLNSRREKFKNAIRLNQSEEDKPAEVDERLQSIEQKLDSLLQHKTSSKQRLPKKS